MLSLTHSTDRSQSLSLRWKPLCMCFSSESMSLCLFQPVLPSVSCCWYLNLVYVLAPVLFGSWPLRWFGDALCAWCHTVRIAVSLMQWAFQFLNVSYTRYPCDSCLFSRVRHLLPLIFRASVGLKS